MDYLPKKLAIVERWLLVKVGLYNKIMYFSITNEMFLHLV